MELTNEQWAKVFAMYLGCRVLFQPIDKIEGGTILGAYSERFVRVLIKPDGNFTANWYGVEETNTKLILRTVDQITADEFKTIADILFPQNTLSVLPRKHVYAGDMAIRFHLFDESWDSEHEYDTASSRTLIAELRPYRLTLAFQYLLSIHIAVPLFIAPGHPLNGQDAIALGLAVKAE